MAIGLGGSGVAPRFRSGEIAFSFVDAGHEVASKEQYIGGENRVKS